MNNPKEAYLELYEAAHNNGFELMTEAEILFNAGKYARAYVLAFTGLEEIAKSQIAADVWTEFIDEAEFEKVFCRHEKKIERMAWASEAAEHYLAMPKEEYLDIEEPETEKRMHGLYVHFRGGKVRRPQDLISKKDAESIIHVLGTAIHRIWEMTQHYGHQIGTKGFMK